MDIDYDRRGVPMMGKRFVILLAVVVSTVSCGVRGESQQVSYVLLDEAPPDVVVGRRFVAVAIEGVQSIEVMKNVICQVARSVEDENPAALGIHIYYDLAVADYIPGAPGDGSLGEFRAAHWLGYYEWRSGSDLSGLNVATGEFGERYRPAIFHPFDHSSDCPS